MDTVFGLFLLLLFENREKSKKNKFLLIYDKFILTFDLYGGILW